MSRLSTTDSRRVIPMSDVKVTVFDGAYHDVDSSEMAFKICASICFKEAACKAKPGSCSSR